MSKWRWSGRSNIIVAERHTRLIPAAEGDVTDSYSGCVRFTVPQTKKEKAACYLTTVFSFNQSACLIHVASHCMLHQLGIWNYLANHEAELKVIKHSTKHRVGKLATFKSLYYHSAQLAGTNVDLDLDVTAPKLPLHLWHAVCLQPLPRPLSQDTFFKHKLFLL